MPQGVTVQVRPSAPFLFSFDSVNTFNPSSVVIAGSPCHSSAEVFSYKQGVFMKNVLNRLALVSVFTILSAAQAFAVSPRANRIEIDVKGGGKIVLFKDVDGQPRCFRPCARISVMMVRPRALGASHPQVVTVQREGTSEEQLHTLDQFSAVFRHPGSPTVARETFMVGANVSADTYRVIATGRACMNPTSTVCTGMAIKAEAQILGSEMMGLAAVERGVLAREYDRL